jgi:hypothetical protein
MAVRLSDIKSSYLNGSPTSDHLSCSIVPQTLHYSVPHFPADSNIHNYRCVSLTLYTVFLSRKSASSIHSLCLENLPWSRNNKEGRMQDMKSKQTNKQKNKQTPWPSVRKRTIPTERRPLFGEILRIEGCRVVSAADSSRSLISVF